MNTSFYNGISGVKTQQFGLDVIGNNISNISTNGFIAKTPEFSTLFSTALTDNYFDSTSNDMGTGSTASAASLNTFTQGTFQPTDRVFDLALDGKGFFGLQSLGNQTLYSRNGAFNIDANGDMVDDGGNYLLGTLGGNISETTLSKDKLEEFGTYYKTDSKELGTPYKIEPINDITLGAVNNQSKINLPDILYYPPEATTYVNYQANLNPKILSDVTQVDIDEKDISSKTNNNQTITINGTISNTVDAQNPQAGDIAMVTITDINGDIVSINTKLNNDLTWNINSKDINSLDRTNKLIVNAKLQTTQEIPNVEHFTTEIIAPNGGKSFVDMTFTKRVPQESLETSWDAKLQILQYYEDYKIETYDPTKTYDESIYNINLETNQVTKIYDPALYKVDTGLNKVYKIVDEQSGDATFSGSGELIESNMPILSNEGTPLNVNIGSPYEQINLDTPEATVSNNQIIFQGTNSGLEKGKQVNVKFTDPDGFERTANGIVEDDGSWSAVQEYNFDTNPTSINAYNIVHSGFEGMISHVDLDKARVSQKDGIVEGILNTYGMDTKGNITAEFDNGKTIPIAKVAVYHFRNEQGLSNVTSTLFSGTSNSGDALFYTDENGTPFLGARIRPNNLETSNVSFSTALTELLLTQKAFDASAKSITTSDQLIQNAINMKK